MQGLRESTNETVSNYEPKSEYENLFKQWKNTN